MLDSGDPSEFARYKPLLLAYDRDCFERLDELHDATVAAISEVSGYLFLNKRDIKVPVCSAFRISDRLIVTARHCLWWHGAKLDPIDFELRILKAPRSSFAVLNYDRVRDERPLTDLNDFVVLKADTSALGFKSGLLRYKGDVPRRESLIIPSISVYSFWFRQKLNIHEWPAAMRLDESSSCVLFPLADATLEAKANCVLTQCQTLPSMSGNPIFYYDKSTNAVTLGGMHLRGGILSATEAHRECGNHPGFNVGIRLPPAVINLVN